MYQIIFRFAKQIHSWSLRIRRPVASDCSWVSALEIATEGLSGWRFELLSAAWSSRLVQSSVGKAEESLKDAKSFCFFLVSKSRDAQATGSTMSWFLHFFCRSGLIGAPISQLVRRTDGWIAASRVWYCLWHWWCFYGGNAHSCVAIRCSWKVTTKAFGRRLCPGVSSAVE